MPRPAAKKTAVNVRLPRDVVQHIDSDYYSTGLERANRILAALCLFECSNGSLRKKMLEWATRMSEGSITWDHLLTHIENTKQDALDLDKLDADLSAALARRRAHSAKPR